MKNSVFAMLALAGLAASANASTVGAQTTLASVTFLNKNTIDAQGAVINDRDTWVATAGGTVDAIRITGSLTRVQSGTFASEAQVRISAGAGQAFTGLNRSSSTTGSYTGTIAVDRTLANTPFTLNNGGTVNFEWFESFQDGTAGLPESRFDTVTYDFLSSPITNGNFSAGSTVSDGTVASFNGSNVSGGLDFYTLALTDGVLSPGHYLNLQTRAQTGGSTGYDSEIAIYDSLGNLVATDDDGASGTGFFSMLSFGASDPNLGDNAPGSAGAILAAGNYTIVVGGFDTIFGATINAITPGAASGTYALDIRTVPTPGAASLLGLAGLAAARRRRA